ncbi:MAG: type 4a pilus biogenesis protein PilO [Candidatus Euphemobacter frigidus]|nr:type 4a pilus biogenesis protein PilO [Candidatus Euphemobacter frigidus]MDP8275580.1 type 4a pilus biogenesis protein PilO [Candidatus Euphemobacter frigidus]
MNYTLKALGILFGVVFLLVIFRLFVLGPVSGKLERLQKEAKALDKEIAEVELKKADIPTIRAKIATARERLERLETQYPRTIELIYQAITEAAREVGFKISRRDTAEVPIEDEASTLRVYEINISARCPYRVLGEFLEHIANLPIIISVSDLAIMANHNLPASKGEENNLQVELELTTYLSRPDIR